MDHAAENTQKPPPHALVLLKGNNFPLSIFKQRFHKRFLDSHLGDELRKVYKDGSGNLHELILIGTEVCTLARFDGPLINIPADGQSFAQCLLT